VIQIKKKSGQEFMVTAEKGSGKTEYTVTLDDEYYQRLTGGKITEEELIKKSFQFLMGREPKESIFSRFNLRVIKSYFPEYEREIKVV